jgi:hypothetical protein
MFRFFIRAIDGLWSWLNTRSRFSHREEVVSQYVRAGAQFGEALSYIAMGECVGFHSMQRKWAQTEREYAKLGYRTLAVDDFIEHGGYGKSIDHLLRVERASAEPTVYHAEVFAQRYKDGFRPRIDFKSLLNDGSPQFGQIHLPTTRDAEVHVRPKSDDDCSKPK